MTNNIAMITGASGGLARAVASHMADRGWQLALVSRNLDKLRHSISAPTTCLIEADVSTASGRRLHRDTSATTPGLSTLRQNKRTMSNDRTSTN